MTNLVQIIHFNNKMVACTLHVKQEDEALMYYEVLFIATYVILLLHRKLKLKIRSFQFHNDS